MPLDRVLFLNSGYCTQWGYLAGRRSRRRERFHAVFVYLEHPQHGPALIDTGYGPYFREATHRFPGRLYRWMTPVRLDPRRHAAGVLAAHGVQPEAIRTVFVSHFHADHIAGLRHFPKAQFIYRRRALESLLRESTWQQVRDGFLRSLLPEDFSVRGTPLEEDVWTAGTGTLSEFRVCDVWGDGTVLLVDLPGHAEGHTGYALQTTTARIFYIVDATWDMNVLRQGRPLPRLSRGFQHSYAAYLDTQARLRRLAARGDFRLLACHCPETQRYVARLQN